MGMPDWNSEERVRKDSAKSLEKNRFSVDSGHESESPRVNRKFIDNWRHACDKTKDRTKELLKKWRTVPEPGDMPENTESGAEESKHGWSEHVWTTWVKRCPSGEGSLENKVTIDLTVVQREKFVKFFINLLDMDCDDVVSLCDFENLFERFRHFADWSKNSSEHHLLLEVQRGFVEYFLLSTEEIEEKSSYGAIEKVARFQQIEMDEWLCKWSAMLSTAKNFLQLPLWLQYFPILLFQVINRSGSEQISEEELCTFYTSVVGLKEQQVKSVIGSVYKMLTSNSSHELDVHVYRLCFANFIFGRYPNGPGQWLFYPLTKTETNFPIDYKAMACAPQDLEQYSPQVKTDRRSVIV